MDRIHLISVTPSKWTSFLCGGSNWLEFSFAIENDSFVVRGAEIDCVRAVIGLFLVWWSIDLVLLWASKLTWFLCEWSKLAWFQRVRSFINEQKRSGLQTPVNVDWVAHCSIRYTRTKDVRDSKPTEVVLPLFLKCMPTQQPTPK